MQRVLITGANGRLGRRLIRTLANDRAVSAVVRSARAAAALEAHVGTSASTVVVDYADEDALARAIGHGDSIVHLVGIIKESASSTYHAAHEAAASTLASAAARAGAARIVAVSILGAQPADPNACLRSRGRADEILIRGAVPATVLRVPMVLGEGDHASTSLAAAARRRIAFSLRAASREQPIYAGDVVAAIVAALEHRNALGIVNLAGPESLTRRELVRRAAGRCGRSPRVVSLPLSLGLVYAALLEALLEDPPITRAMLGVLDRDNAIDPVPTAHALGIDLTPLDETLERVLVSA